MIRASTHSWRTIEYQTDTLGGIKRGSIAPEARLFAMIECASENWRLNVEVTGRTYPDRTAHGHPMTRI